MALWNIKNVKLAGVAGAVPDKVVDTHDFDFFNREEADVFIDTVGIENDMSLQMTFVPPTCVWQQLKI